MSIISIERLWVREARAVIVATDAGGAVNPTPFTEMVFIISPFPSPPPPKINAPIFQLFYRQLIDSRLVTNQCRNQSLNSVNSVPTY